MSLVVCAIFARHKLSDSHLGLGEHLLGLLKMVEIKARVAAKAEFTNVNEHFAATNNAEFVFFQQNLVM